MVKEKKFYLTAKGLSNLKKEYEIFRDLRLSKTKGEAPKIFESEDLNPEYLSFREDLSFLERRLAELGDILKNAELIKRPSKKGQNIIDLGATVRVEVEGDKDEFTIVGSLEANPSMGRISDKSPVGKALLEHQVGDEIVVSSTIKTIYKVKRINYNSI